MFELTFWKEQEEQPSYLELPGHTGESMCLNLCTYKQEGRSFLCLLCHQRDPRPLTAVECIRSELFLWFEFGNAIYLFIYFGFYLFKYSINLPRTTERLYLRIVK